MKIRQGFVSNSSSSSFVITGKGYTQRDFEKILFEYLTEDQKKEYNEDPQWFCEGKVFTELFPKLDVVYDYESEVIYLGKIPVATKEAKDRAHKLIKNFDKKVELNQITLTNDVLY